MLKEQVAKVESAPELGATRMRDLRGLLRQWRLL